MQSWRLRVVAFGASLYGKLSHTTAVLALALVLGACSDDSGPDNFAEKHMDVKVTAYNAVPWQTKVLNPDIAAWGDTLKEGMKAIAVSRDLLRLGLVHGTPVRIDGLEGEYLVLDKMNQRYTRRIDIFMGLNVDSARSWGVQPRRIYWKVERESKYDKRYQYAPPDTAIVK